MPYLGDSYCSAIVDLELDQTTPTQEVKTVHGNNLVAQHESNLSSGSIDFQLHGRLHDRSESFEEQLEGFDALPRRDAPEVPFDYGHRRGYLAIRESQYAQTNNPFRCEAYIDTVYLPDQQYHPSLARRGHTLPNDYSVSNDGLVALPSGVEHVTSISQGSQTEIDLTATESLSTDSGTIDFYNTSEDRINFEYPASAFGDTFRTGPIRVYDHNNSVTPADWDRVYHTSHAFEGAPVVSNGIARFSFNAADGATVRFEWYDGSSWVHGGSIDFTTRRAALMDYSHDRAKVKFADGMLTLRRGFPTGWFSVSGVSSVTYETTNGDYPIEAVADNGLYILGENSSLSDSHQMIKPSSDGDLGSSGTDLTASGLSAGTDYNLFIGALPSSVAEAQFSEYTLTDNNVRRDLLGR